MTHKQKFAKRINWNYIYNYLDEPPKQTIYMIDCPACGGIGRIQGSRCDFCEGHKTVTIQEYETFYGTVHHA